MNMLDLFCLILGIFGLISFFVAFLGIFRFPSALSKSHSLGIADSLGLPIILLAMSLSSMQPLQIVKGLFLIVIMLLTGQASTFMLCNIFYRTEQKEKLNSSQNQDLNEL